MSRRGDQEGKRILVDKPDEFKRRLISGLICNAEVEFHFKHMHTHTLDGVTNLHLFGAPYSKARR